MYSVRFFIVILLIFMNNLKRELMIKFKINYLEEFIKTHFLVKLI